MGGQVGGVRWSMVWGRVGLEGQMDRGPGIPLSAGSDQLVHDSG